MHSLTAEPAQTQSQMQPRRPSRRTLRPRGNRSTLLSAAAACFTLQVPDSVSLSRIHLPKRSLLLVYQLGSVYQGDSGHRVHMRRHFALGGLLAVLVGPAGAQAGTLGVYDCTSDTGAYCPLKNGRRNCTSDSIFWTGAPTGACVYMLVYTYSTCGARVEVIYPLFLSLSPPPPHSPSHARI